LGEWVRRHPAFVLATNEAGMQLGDASRGADAAIFERGAVGPYTGKFRRVPPVLAVEVSGGDESVGVLREKARWYLSVGVAQVWLVIPEERAVLAVTHAGERRFERGESLAEVPELPRLTPAVAGFFRQLDTGGDRRS
jgi:Uma2 family endonuclease